jgi:pimeloyl-ACP methyl ester carboxylesterase
MRTEAFTLKSYDGRERAAERVRLTVPADPVAPDGRTLEIVFDRLRAPGTATRPPIVFLMGGPGVPATAMAKIPPYFTLFSRLAEGGDVILLDQRSLGESSPKSDCPPAKTSLPADLFERHGALLDAFAASYTACAASLAPQVLPTDFTIDKIADDVDRIRQALGVPQVDLLGFSFGSRIALEVLRRHPDTVRRVVLQGVLGVDTIRMPSMDDQVFRLYAAAADAQAKEKGVTPNQAEAVKTLQARAARAPLPLTIKTVAGEARAIKLGREMLDATILGHLGDSRLPAALTTAVSEDYSLLVPWVQSMYQDLEKGAGSLMARAMLCSVASEPAARRRARLDGPKVLLGEAFDNQMQDDGFCQAVGVTPPAAQPAVKSRVPALLISGTHDPRTPPDRAAESARDLAGREHVIVQNGGHELLPDPEVQDLVLAFLDGKPARKPIVQPPWVVRTIEEARQPPRRPGG